jgi:transketolase
MKLPITILGVGAGFAYDIMGPTHHTLEDIAIMRACPGLEIYSPADSVCAAALAKLSYERLTPKYIRFDRAGIPDIYKDDFQYESLKFWYPNAHKVQPDAWIVATGVMVHQALNASTELLKHYNKWEVGVVDVTRIIPFDGDDFLERIDDMTRDYDVPLISLEEHFLSGGLGSVVSEILHDAGKRTRLLRIGIPDVYHFEPWGREEAWRKYGLTTEAIVKRIREWL